MLKSKTYKSCSYEHEIAPKESSSDSMYCKDLRSNGILWERALKPAIFIGPWVDNTIVL